MSKISLWCVLDWIKMLRIEAEHIERALHVRRQRRGDIEHAATRMRHHQAARQKMQLAFNRLGYNPRRIALARVGKKYSELPENLQDHIRYFSLRTITFKRESDPSIKFEVFERLNTGSVSLNDQELRNCINHGEFNGLLKELSEDPDFMYLLGLTKPDKRRNISREDAQQLRSAFKNTCQIIRSMFGKNAFKRFYRGTSGGNICGYWEPKKNSMRRSTTS